MFLLIYFIQILFWYFILKKILKYNLFEIRFITFILSLIIIFNYLGYPFLYYQLDKFRALDVDLNIINKLFYVNSLSINLIILTYIFLTIFKKNILYPSFYNSSDNYKQLNHIQFMVILFFIFTCFYVFLLYLTKLGTDNIAFLNALRGFDALTVAQNRSSMGNSFIGKVHRYQLFFYDILPFLFFILFANYLIKPTKFGFLMIVLIFLPIIFILLVSANKAKVPWFFIGCFITYSITKNESKINLKYSLYLFLILILFVSFLYQLFNPNISLENAYLSFFSRIFTGPIQAASYYYYFFPDFHEFLKGRSFPNPGGIFPFESISITQLISDLVNYDEYMKRDIRGSTPAIFWAEMYGNFSYLGIIISSIFVSIILFFWDSVFSNSKLSSLKIGFMTWLLLHYKDLSVSGFSKYLIDIKLILVILILSIIVLIQNTKVTYKK